MVKSKIQDMERNILCFGDSNTWGYDPSGDERFDRASRWPGILSSLLGTGWHVIEEGLNGRTTVFNDPLERHRRGSDALEMLLESHAPLDLVIIMLGTNDAKARFSATPLDIANGWKILGKTVLDSSAGPSGDAPKLLLVSPPLILDVPTLPETFCGAPEKSLRFSKLCKDIALELNCYFLDSGEIAATSTYDGIHLARESHAKLARAIHEAIQEILSSPVHD
jgi:lysophospholipase L1-like esterase